MTYRAPSAAEFNSTAVDVEGGSSSTPLNAADNDNLYLGAGHGFVSGDEVIYRATENGAPSGRPIGGLTDGGRYFVIFNSSKPNEIQLAATYDQAVGVPANDNGTPEDPSDDTPAIPITPLELTPAKETADRDVVHSLCKVGDQPMGGLTDGITYYVVNRTVDTFQLSATAAGTAISLDPTDPVSHATLTGISRIGAEGVDLTATGTGEQQLAIDITAASSGTHLLEGVGGARALADAPSGDGIVTSAASGKSGGLVQVSGSSTRATSSPTVDVTVGAGAELTARDVAIDATSIGNASSMSANSGGGLVSVGSADSSVTVNTTAGVSLGNGASVTATHDISILSTTTQNAEVLSQTGSGGLAGFGDADVRGTLTYNSGIQIGDGVVMSAENELLAESRSSLKANAGAEADAAGLGADASTSARLDVTGATATRIGEDARLEAGTVKLKATVTGMQARSKAESDATAAIADSDASAQVNVTETTDVVLASGAWVEGDTAEILSRHQNIDLSTRADADSDGLYGDASAPATTDYESDSAIHVNDGATVAGHSVLVQSQQTITRYDRSTRADSGALGGESDPEHGDFNAGRNIVYDGDVVMLIRPDPVLTIDEIGRVTEAVNITVNGGQGAGYDVNGTSSPGSSPISVDNIGNLNVAGTALIQANSVAGRDGKTAPDSTISGSQGTARVKTTYDAITITNLSGEELRLNAIQPTNPNATGQVTLDAKTVTAEFDIADSSGPTDITVINDKGTSDVVINGLINNPTGLTTILNQGGQVRDTAFGTIRTNDLVMTGTEIGSAANRLDVELVRSTGRPTGMSATSAGDIYMDLIGRLRETDAGHAVFATDTLSAGGHVDLLLQTAVQETDPVGVVAGITFTVTQEPLPHTASYVNHFRPDAGAATPLDPAIYADTTKAAPVAATYDFGQLTAGGNIVAVAAAPGVADTTVNVLANTDVLGTGYIHTLTNGNIGRIDPVGHRQQRQPDR